ncbi:MAG: methionine--tRNA ligase [Planctomycetota bacterium]|nr:MAG: methionine--tRNA ligase [Planctomycetota bacterium]
MTRPDRFYVTTPIYYVNDRPHIGHCYTTLLADAAARMNRLLGRETFFLTGTDEHAEKVVAAAAEHGLSPMDWASRNAEAFREAFAELDISNDDFIRTSEPRHTERLAGYIRRLQDSGDIALGDYEGWWDPSQEEYVTETAAREHNFQSPVTGRPLVKRTEKNYFFRLSAYADRLLAHIEAHPGFIRPEARRNEVVGRIRQGLQDVPVSRAVQEGDADWGVLMPGDPGHRVYVWIDALCNYLTAVDTPERRAFWPADAHLVGKDILWFHAVIWPCLLMALGEDLPGCVYAHSYWIREGRKMSKSLGNFLDMPTLRGYAGAFGVDAVRWFLLTQGPAGATDADFAHARFVEVYNADLANSVGNALNRVTNMIGRYCDGAVPDAGGSAGLADHDWPAIAAGAVERAAAKADAMDLPGALAEGLALVRRVDGYIHATEPFKLAKDPSKRGEVAAILHHAAEALRIAGLVLWPAMPGKMEALWRRLGWEAPIGRAPLSELARWGGLTPGARAVIGDPLFPRADPAAPPPAPAPG